MNILNKYYDAINGLVDSKLLLEQCDKVRQLILQSSRLFFIGNGGSSCIAQHMSEDFTKCVNIPALSLDGAGLITCLANDYKYEDIYTEWLKRFYKAGDLIIAISSSGESKNIVNVAKRYPGDTITLTGFSPTNTLSQLGIVNIHIPVCDFGVVECVHQIILHAILDKIYKDFTKQ